MASAPPFARRYALAVAVGVFLLLVAGALVTSTGSGLAVPDWPLSYGQVMPPMVGGILFEHGHRLVAAAVSTLVGLLVAVLLFAKAPRRLVTLAAAAFGAILAQAVLGGLTVIFRLPQVISAAHACLAQVVFALVAAIALLAALPEGEEAGEGAAELRGALEEAWRRVTLATFAVYLQIALGAVMRHMGAGLAIPDFPTSFGGFLPPLSALARPEVAVHLAHRLGAVAVALLVIRAATSLTRLERLAPFFRKAATAWVVLLVAQATLGMFAIWTARAVPVTVAHLAVGGLCFVTGVLAAVRLARFRAAVGDAEGSGRPLAAVARDYVELTKPRITLFVVLTAFVGFVVGAGGPIGALPLGLLLHTLLGTALVASGTSAFNQLREVELDARMERTARRPLPAGRLPVAGAFVFASLLSAAGLAELWAATNAVTAALAAATLLSYVFVYTPLKTRSTLATLVGAVPGALPPLGGFTAARGGVEIEGLVLFGILFFWQLPHFHAIGWRHRGDYGRAGFRIHATVDPSGKTSGLLALGYAALLLPFAVAPSFLGVAGHVYGAGALLLTAAFVASSARFFARTTDAAAKELFLVSIGWLPAILFLLLADRIV